MASTTTPRYPVKAKSLTLLELCQTINDLRNTSSRNTAQILTRRLYLHPLTISNNAKQHSSKLISHSLADIEQYHQTVFDKKKYSSKNPAHRNLSVFSSSLPLSTRSNAKMTSSINSDRGSSGDLEASSTSFSNNSIRLPAISRKLPPLPSSSSSKRSGSNRSPFIAIEKKSKPGSNNEQEEKIDVWGHLVQILQRPMPKNPPTTPLDIICDSDYQDIQIYKSQPTCDSIIDEED